jgi:hypothetical protein
MFRDLVGSTALSARLHQIDGALRALGRRLVIASEPA